MKSPPLRLSVRIHVLLASGLAVLVAEKWLLVGLTLACLGVLRVFAGRDALRPLISKFFLAFAGISLLFGAVFLADDPIRGLELGGGAVLRAGILIATARWVSADASPLEMADLAHRIRMPWLGLALGVALNALPDLEASVRRSLDVAKLRGGWRRNRLRTMRHVAVSAITHALIRADAQAEAAQARGLQVNPPRQPGPPYSVSELLLVNLLWLTSVATCLYQVIHIG